VYNPWDNREEAGKNFKGFSENVSYPHYLENYKQERERSVY